MNDGIEPRRRASLPAFPVHCLGSKFYRLALDASIPGSVSDAEDDVLAVAQVLGKPGARLDTG